MVSKYILYSRISKAGLYAIFTTQSNDFALGYPILMAIYEKVILNCLSSNWYISISINPKSKT